MSDEGKLTLALKEFVTDVKWQCLGKVSDFTELKCVTFYAVKDDPADLQDDIAVFCFPPNRFYAIDCTCPHEGGPLDVGDIEDLDGEPTVFCPWHMYDFNLRTGKSMTSLETQTYETKVADGKLYIQTDAKLTKTRPSLIECLEEEAKSAAVSTKNDPSSDSDIGNHLQSTTISNEDDLAHWAVKILNSPDPSMKVDITNEVADKWKACIIKNVGSCKPPDQPSRADLDVVEPGKIKRGKGGTLASRIAMLHSLANIEQWAIDLAWDIIARFSTVKINNKPLPKEFFDDFVRVAAEEAKHYRLLEERLRKLGSHFGALAVHNGLWQSASETSDSLLSRLAIVHMVHEARGLDVHPKTSARFEAQNDKESVQLMDIIYTDEITHVSTGMKWFLYICKQSDPPLYCIPTFHNIVRKHFRGYLKPPFNTEGRRTAGMTKEWYEPLMKQSVSKPSAN